MPGRDGETVVLLTKVLVLRERHPHACVAAVASAALAEKLKGLAVRRPRRVGALVHLRQPLVHLAVKGLVPGLPRHPLHEPQFTPRASSRGGPPPGLTAGAIQAMAPFEPLGSYVSLVGHLDDRGLVP